MLKLGLIGAGRMGSIHAMNAGQLAGVELSHVIDIDGSVAERLATTHAAKHADAPSSLLSDDTVDAVIIASATATHANLIAGAARQGKAVFCENPIGLNLEEVETALEAVDKAGVPLFVGFNRRFDQSHRRLRAAVAAGAVGRIEMLNVVSRSPEMPSADYLKTSGDLFHDLTIHDFDVARWMLGEEPVEVHATGSALIEPSLEKSGDVDTAMLTLRTASGALCHIANSRRSAFGFDQRVEVFGEKGMLQTGYAAEITYSHWSADGVRLDNPPYRLADRYGEAFRVELKHFVSVLKSGDPKALEVSGKDGHRAHVLADAASRSLLQKKPIQIA
jgi:myo-inositol 2-dehydrogenase/D-chiro-inositol 1-dehydrogenase